MFFLGFFFGGGVGSLSAQKKRLCLGVNTTFSDLPGTCPNLSPSTHIKDHKGTYGLPTLGNMDSVLPSSSVKSSKCSVKSCKCTPRDQVWVLNHSSSSGISWYIFANHPYDLQASPPACRTDPEKNTIHQIKVWVEPPHPKGWIRLASWHSCVWLNICCDQLRYI